MRTLPLLAVLAALMPEAAAAQAPEPGQPPAQTPAQDAAQQMIQVYEEFCLVRFPNLHAVTDGVTAHHMTPAAGDQAAQALLGRPGTAWQIVTPKGTMLVAVESGGRQGCAVSGDVADDAGVRGAFDLLVTGFASGHEFGTLTKPPLQQGLVKGQPAALQLIGATPDGRPRQAFVNMATGAGPVMHVRLTREFAPEGAK
jgi:hypothetical protein